MYVRVCVPVCVCLYVCLCQGVCVFMPLCVFLVPVCAYASVCVLCLCVCMFMPLCVFCACVCLCLCVCFVPVCVCLFVPVCVCACVCVVRHYTVWWLINDTFLLYVAVGPMPGHDGNFPVMSQHEMMQQQQGPPPTSSPEPGLPPLHQSMEPYIRGSAAPGGFPMHPGEMQPTETWWQMTQAPSWSSSSLWIIVLSVIYWILY